MGIGSGIFLIAVGAIMRYAITANAEGIDIQAAGGILMIVGAIGLAISLLWMLTASFRGRDEVVVRRDPYRDTY